MVTSNLSMGLSPLEGNCEAPHGSRNAKRVDGCRGAHPLHLVKMTTMIGLTMLRRRVPVVKGSGPFRVPRTSFLGIKPDGKNGA